MAEVLYKDEAYAIMGAGFEVYSNKDCGFLDVVYPECFEIEFGLRNLPFVPREELILSDKGRPLKRTFQPDFTCCGKIIVELKAVSALADEHRAQVHNYLKASGYRLGLLVNSGAMGKLEYERIAR